MIRVISVGKVKERYLAEGVLDFLKRLGRFVKVEHAVVKDMGKEKEGEKIIGLLGEREYVVCMGVGGERYDSVGFAGFLKKKLLEVGDVVFVIGGAEGLSEKVLDRGDCVISLSDMTFTHEMCLVFLLEQVYRAFMINEGRKYHR